MNRTRELSYRDAGACPANGLRLRVDDDRNTHRTSAPSSARGGSETVLPRGLPKSRSRDWATNTLVRFPGSRRFGGGAGAEVAGGEPGDELEPGARVAIDEARRTPAPATRLQAPRPEADRPRQFNARRDRDNSGASNRHRANFFVFGHQRRLSLTAIHDPPKAPRFAPSLPPTDVHQPQTGASCCSASSRGPTSSDRRNR